jgi:hypothetical protein
MNEEYDRAVMDTKIKEFGRDIKYLYGKLGRIEDNLDTIKRSVDEIKWVAVGGLSFYALTLLVRFTG